MKKLFSFIALSLWSSTFMYGQTFTLKSKDLGGQATFQQVFNGFGCTGGNISPELH